MVHKSGLTKHGEIRAMLISELGLGYGDANALADYALKSEGERAAGAKGVDDSQVLDEIYSGAKAALRPIHDRLKSEIDLLGEFEISPKKGYVSLRCKKQFAMIGPATNTRVELGLNVKNLEANARLAEVPPGGMCNYKVRLADPQEVDDELIAWIKRAFESTG
jgi:hypothetical protein